MLTANGMTVEDEQKILEAGEKASKGEDVIGPFETAEDLMTSLRSNMVENMVQP